MTTLPTKTEQKPKLRHGDGILIYKPIQDSVGNGMFNRSDDVCRVKSKLHHIGFFKHIDDSDQDTPDNPTLTRKMDDAIKTFQRDNGLKVDGKLNPGGETERALSNRIAQADPMAIKPKRKPADEANAPTPKPPPKPARPPKRTATKDNPYGYDEDILNAAKPPKEKDHTGPRIREEGATQSAPLPIPKRRPEVIESTRKGNELLDFIGQLESSDNYNVIYGNEEKPLTKMTVKEVQELQQKMIDNGLGSSAVGRYQIKRTTLEETLNKLGIQENEVFDEKLQDQLARSLMERRGFEDYKAGKINTETFIKRLANEWAALPPDASNKSRYEGLLNNKALTDFKTLKDLLEQ